MVALWLINHQWKETVRSGTWQKNLVLNLIVGFFILLMALYLLLLGILINKVLQELYPGQDHFSIFNGFLLYYLLVDIFMRFILQNLPKLFIETYLHLPIKKKRILHFMVSKTVFSVFNFLPLLIFIPVAINLAGPQAGVSGAWAWLLILFLFILANNFLATYLKRALSSKPYTVLIYAVLIMGMIILDRFNIISLSGYSSLGFSFLVNNPVYIILPGIWMLFNYYLHYYFLKKRLYPEELQKRKSEKTDSISNMRYLSSLGITGSIIALDMRLFLRNKRTKTILYMFPLFILYGLFFYPNPQYKDAWGFLIFVGIFMSGGMMLNYANYAFAYESNYFDGLLTKNINFKQYVRVKYIISLMISTVCFILTIPYLYFGREIFFINVATYLYNIGILSFLLLYMATYNKKRLELTRGATFNYQGMSSMNWLAMFPAFLVPVLIYWPFSAAGVPYTGLLFIGLLGVLGLIFNRTTVALITRNFYKRKYIMASGFRQRGG